MAEKRKAKIRVIAGSGNVFADIGLPEPEEELAKAQLASRIGQIIRRERLTQLAASSRMGIDQPKVSAILNGRLTNFSSDRLMRLLTALGQNVEIRVSSAPRQQGHIRVIAEELGHTRRPLHGTASAKPVYRAAATASSRRSSRAKKLGQRAATDKIA